MPIWPEMKTSHGLKVQSDERSAEDVFAYGLTSLPLETLTKAFVTQVNGCRVGYAGCQHVPQDDGSIQARVVLYTEPEFRHQGIGGRLLGLLETAARQDGIQTFTCYIRLESDTASFAQAHGWQEAYREVIQGADVFQVPAVTLSGPIKIEFVSGVACTETFVEQIYSVFQDSFPAIASFWSVPTLHAAMTKVRPFNGIALASLKSDIVGFAWGLDAEPNAVFNEFTGVRPASQRQGIARALKSELAKAAAHVGRSRMITSNRLGNQAILTLNQQLGYETVVTMAQFQKA